MSRQDDVVGVSECLVDYFLDLFDASLDYVDIWLQNANVLSKNCLLDERIGLVVSLLLDYRGHTSCIKRSRVRLKERFIVGRYSKTPFDQKRVIVS